MSAPCGRFRAWVGTDEVPEAGSAEQRLRAEHLADCADCREELRKVVDQRAALRETYRTGEAGPPLPEPLVARFLRAMKDAADASRGAPPDGDVGPPRS